MRVVRIQRLFSNDNYYDINFATIEEQRRLNKKKKEQEKQFSERSENLKKALKYGALGTGLVGLGAGTAALDSRLTRNPQNDDDREEFERYNKKQRRDYMGALGGATIAGAGLGFMADRMRRDEVMNDAVKKLQRKQIFRDIDINAQRGLNDNIEDRIRQQLLDKANLKKALEKNPKYARLAKKEGLKLGLKTGASIVAPIALMAAGRAAYNGIKKRRNRKNQDNKETE